MNQTVDSGPWFFGKSMLALAVYECMMALCLCDPSSVALPSIPVWVWILGLPSALLTVAATQLVVDPRFCNQSQHGWYSLRWSSLRSNPSLVVWSCETSFPPSKFEFSPGVTVMLTFKYEKVVGFFKVCGLLEHGTGGYLDFPTLTVWIMYGLFFNYLGYEWHSFIRSEKSRTEFSPFKILITPVYRNPFFRRQFSFQFYFKFLLRRSKIGCLWCILLLFGSAP